MHNFNRVNILFPERSSGQSRLFEDGNTRFLDFIGKFHGRLDEAVFRLSFEPDGHGYKEIAALELDELSDEAKDLGMSEVEFAEAIHWVKQHPFLDEDERSFIETQAGSEIYNGRPTVVLGEGSLPPNDPNSLTLLKAIGVST